MVFRDIEDLEAKQGAGVGQEPHPQEGDLGPENPREDPDDNLENIAAGVVSDSNQGESDNSSFHSSVSSEGKFRIHFVFYISGVHGLQHYSKDLQYLHGRHLTLVLLAVYKVQTRGFSYIYIYIYIYILPQKT